MKHQLTFNFFETEAGARAFCECWNKQQTYYMRKKHPAHFTPWQSGAESKFIAWYYN